MARTTKPVDARTNWLVDVVLTLVFLIVLSPTFTGWSIHEWLGLAVGAVVIVHLLLHWHWITTMTARFRGINALARVNYIVNGVLMITLIVAVLSGFMSSKVVAKALGVSGTGSQTWQGLHSSSTSVLLVMIGLHLALNWKWVTNAVMQFVISPLRGVRR